MAFKPRSPGSSYIDLTHDWFTAAAGVMSSVLDWYLYDTEFVDMAPKLLDLW